MTNLLDTPQKKIVAAVAVVLLIGVYFSLKPSPGSPEAICEEAVREMVKGAKDRSTAPFKKWLSEDVRDDQNRDKREMLRILQGIFLRYPNIELNIISLRAQQDTNPDVVNVDLSMFMSDTALPQDKGDFFLKFRREGSNWRAWQIEWSEGAGYGL